jgi:hypothetical protein
MTRHARDFRNTSEQVDVGELLDSGVWYRSPLWSNDHLVGEDQDFYNDQLSWCGRPLGVARDWEDEHVGGLWISNRKSGNCGPCKTRQEEWNHMKSTQKE